MHPSSLTPAYMKLRIIGTVNRLNVEHRTSNIKHPILMTLRFIYLKTSKPQNTDLHAACDEFPSANSGAGLRHEFRPNIACRRQSNRISKDRFASSLRSHFGGVGLLSHYFKWTAYIIRCWTFDVRCSLVSLPIRSATSLFGGWA